MTVTHTTPPARRLLLPALLAALVLLVSGCALNTEPDLTGMNVPPVDVGPSDTGSTSKQYDTTPLLHPQHKYFGVALPDVPQSLSAVGPYTQAVGKKPNVLEFYASWGDGFDLGGVRRIYQSGSLPFLAWEPDQQPVGDIAAGAADRYVTSFAQDVAASRLPIAISFGHEMNGDWYPWGRTNTTPQQFVAAWHRIHDIFQKAGATNVIWVWSPNIINPAPDTRLAPYYPGDASVDWVGVIGYYANDGAYTFNTLFGPTLKEVRAFTAKPFFIQETASQNSRRRLSDVDDLFSGVQDHPDVLGFVWFDIVKRADWRIETAPGPLADFAKRASNPAFGFDIRNP